MVLSADIFSLLLYCAQQLGVTLAVGAQTILLVDYVMAMRDGSMSDDEAQIARAIRRVLNLALIIIVASGLAITLMHAGAGEWNIILEPAFLFKWLLILLAIAFTLLTTWPPRIMQGLAGGTWSALYLVHILAPVTSWANLLVLYAVWMVGFTICWFVLTYATNEKGRAPRPKPKMYVPPPTPPKPVPPPAPKPVPPPPPPPKPIPPPAPMPVPPPPKPIPPPPPPPVVKTPPPPANLPVLAREILPEKFIPPPFVPKPAPPVFKTVEPPKPLIDEEYPDLPTMIIMPKTPGDVGKQYRATKVEFIQE